MIMIEVDRQVPQINQEYKEYLPQMLFVKMLLEMMTNLDAFVAGSGGFLHLQPIQEAIP